MGAWAQPAKQPPAQPQGGGDSLQTQPGGGGQKDVEIIATDLLHYAKFGKDSLKIRKLLGNVKLRQDSTYIDCDSAYQFVDTSLVLAMGHVYIRMPQERTIRSHSLKYLGTQKVLYLDGNVELQDTSITLYTEHLTYYRTPNYGEYLTGGKIVNKENVLTSRKGYYHPDQTMAYFRDSVRLVNPDYTLTTDTLGYNTDTRIAFFLAPTLVVDSVNTMYTEDGYYDTENDFAYLHTNARIGDTSYTLYADTIQYDQANDLGKAIGHVRAEQNDSSMTVFGKYGEFRSKAERSFITDSTFAVEFMEDDTLYLVADTLYTFKDTVADKRFLFAYFNTKVYMREMQGYCDSLSYHYDDSLLFMYRRPALWSDNSQITGDTIMMGMKGGSIDTMYIPSNAMIASEEDTVGYNQIKGRQISAKFKDKELQTMWVLGNSESIYFTKDDEEKYIGMNHARCVDMHITFKDNKPQKILFKQNPEGDFFPMFMIMDKDNQLEGFEWREEERPVRPEWAAQLVEKVFGPVDTLRRQLDSVLQVLNRLDAGLDSLLGSVLVPEDPAGADPGDAGIADSLGTGMADSLDGGGVDSLGGAIDTLGGPDTLATTPTGKPKGQGQSAEALREDSYIGAGGRPAPAEKQKGLGFGGWIKYIFSSPEKKGPIRLQRQLAKVQRKADREEKRRYLKVERKHRKVLRKVRLKKVNFIHPDIA